MPLSGLVLVALALTMPAAHAPGPVVRAHRASVDLRDGRRLQPGGWAIDPRLALDEYEAAPFRDSTRVVFVTDLDSIAFELKHGEQHEFTFLLNDSDSCRTRVSALRRVVHSAEADTIPFRIAPGGRIRFRGRINDSQELDLMFDTGADIPVVFPSAVRKGAHLELDGERLNRAFGGDTQRRTGRGNRIRIAGVSWEGETILSAEKQTPGFDGIVGYGLFDGRVATFDFDRGIVVVRDSLLAAPDGYARWPLRWQGTLPLVEAMLDLGSRQVPEWFVLDTGSTATVHLTRASAERLALDGTMRRLGSSRSQGLGAGTTRNDVVLLPGLTIAGTTLRDVPVDLEASGTQATSHLGMGVLARWNLILDLRNDVAWVRPNAGRAAPYRRGGPPAWALALGLLLLLAAAAMAWHHVRSRGGLMKRTTLAN